MSSAVAIDGRCRRMRLQRRSQRRGSLTHPKLVHGETADGSPHPPIKHGSPLARGGFRKTDVSAKKQVSRLVAHPGVARCSA